MTEQESALQSAWEAVKALKLPDQIAVADALMPRILADLRARRQGLSHREPRWELRRWLKHLEEAEEYSLKALMRLRAVMRETDRR